MQKIFRLSLYILLFAPKARFQVLKFEFLQIKLG